MVFLEMDTYEIWFLWLYLLFMWCISSFWLLFLQLLLVEYWTSWNDSLLDFFATILYFLGGFLAYIFPLNICLLIIIYFMIKQVFFWLTIHKMVNGSSEFMCLPYVKNAKRALIYLTGGQPSNCSRHIEKEWSQREIF